MLRQALTRRQALCAWLPVALWLLLIFVLSSFANYPHPQSGLVDRLLTSVAHALLFGTLAGLLSRALGERPRSRALAFALTVVYGLLDELHQAFVPGRNPDPWDVFCDTLGAALGLWLYQALRRARHSRLL